MLEGDIGEFGAAALLRMISSGARSGRLDFRRASGRGELIFSAGDVYSAFSSFSPSPLGLQLVRDGVMSARRMRAALDEHVRLGQQLGSVLVDSGDIDPDLLANALRDQLMDRVLDLLEWETGTFTWSPDEEVRLDEIRLDESVSLTVREILEERARRNGLARGENNGGKGPREGGNRDAAAPAAGAVSLAFSSEDQTVPEIFDVVVVCTGNQFRSPLVEGLVRASTTKLPLRVSSVGTKELPSTPALPEAIALASQFGFDLSGHRSRSLAGIDLSGADLVIGFEQLHIATAVVEAGARYDRTFTIVELVGLLGDIPLPAEKNPVLRARAVVEAAHQLRPEGVALPPEAQIGDPLGGPPDGYKATGDLLRGLTRRLLDGLFGYVPFSPPPPH